MSKDNLDKYTQNLIDVANENSNIDINKYITNGKFDLSKFNTGFEREKKEQKELNKDKQNARLNLLNDVVNNKPIYKQTIGEILIGIKDTWFYLIDDLLQQKFTLDTFTKENRLFYIGITLLIFSIILYLLNFFLEKDDEPKIKNNEKIVKKYYYYQGNNDKENNNKQNDKENNGEKSNQRNKKDSNEEMM